MTLRTIAVSNKSSLKKYSLSDSSMAARAVPSSWVLICKMRDKDWASLSGKNPRITPFSAKRSNIACSAQPQRIEHKSVQRQHTQTKKEEEKEKEMKKKNSFMRIPWHWEHPTRYHQRA
jgi:hypothetical protein